MGLGKKSLLMWQFVHVLHPVLISFKPLVLLFLPQIHILTMYSCEYNLKCFQVMYIVVPKMYVQCQDSEVLYLVYATIWPVHGLCHILTGDGDSPLSRLNTSLLTVLVMRVTHDIISIIDLCKPALCLNKQLKFQLHVRTNDC